MQILVMSDSHGKTKPIKGLLDKYINLVQAVVHLGDNARDLLQFEADYPSLVIKAVAGNCDFGCNAQGEFMLKMRTKSDKLVQILLLHGHKHNVKLSYDRLAYYAQEKKADACFFGHTHMPDMFWRGQVFFLNPGSIGEPRGANRAGYALVNISETGEIEGKVLEL